MPSKAHVAMKPRIGTIEIESADRRLPSVGEPPFWSAPMKAMTKRLGLGQWNKGGCFAFAEALAEAFDGELWGICEFVPDPEHSLGGDYPVHHAIVKIGDLFYDYRGVVDIEKELKSVKGKTLHLKAKDDPTADVFWFEDEFLDDDDMLELNTILKS
jgi:hypothetical protein